MTDIANPANDNPANATADTPTTRRKLAEARRNLVDLTRRNRMLNFRGTGKQCIRIVDEKPAEVYRILVEEERAMQYLALEESHVLKALVPEGGSPNPVDSSEADVTELKLDLAAIDDGAAGPAERHTDQFLQTALNGPALQSRLLTLARAAESAIQEQGTNLLYLAVGQLEWTDAAGVASRAPLVMVPVELFRRSAKHRHAVRLLDDELMVNPAIEFKCQHDFKITLPALDPEHEAPIDDYLSRLRPVIAEVSGWSVHDDMYVGLFSFAKHRMYLDLDEAQWPADVSVAGHLLVRRLLGEPVSVGEAFESIPPELMDERISPHETFQVLDADSSQQAAILAAKRGGNLVIQGPPGTGKSQTITNIIAECLSEGRTVLFVAEKAAALEVVHRRLGQVGLGDFVLELHSKKSNKKAVMEELDRTMRVEFARPAQPELDASTLADLRAKLNAYVRTMHEPAGALEMPPFQAIGRCAALSSAPESAVPLGDVAAWNRDTLNRTSECVARLAAAATRVGDRAAHPWRGVGVIDVALDARQGLPGRLGEVERSVEACSSAGARLAESLGVAQPTTFKSLRDAMDAAAILAGAPELPADAASSSTWDTMPADAQLIIRSGKRLAELRAALSPRWKRSAEDVDWNEVATRRARQSGSIFRWLRPSWRGDSRLIGQHVAAGVKPTDRRLLADFAGLVEIRGLKQELRNARLRGAQLFGTDWRDDESDWGAIERVAAAATAIRRLIREQRVTEAAAQQLAEPAAKAELSQRIGAARAATDAFERQFGEITTTLKLDAAAWLSGPAGDAPFEAWRERLTTCASRMESLPDWCDFIRAAQSCIDEGLSAFVGWTREDGAAHAPASWLPAFQRQFYRTWLDAMARERPALRDFRGDEHERLIAQFREADRKWLEVSRARLAARIAERLPDARASTSKSSRLGILKAEVRKKRRIRPLRQLFAAAGDVVQSIKPCLMMSPLSVAQYLEPGRMTFDVVIFDEASQVEPADALGAIARGRQLILVGDEKQLPPTNFFNTVAADDADAAIDEEATSDLESILSVGLVALPHTETLRWHYRSRHASLISFSNAEFYDGALRVFPSPDVGRTERGLAFHLVSDAVYQRGRGRVNPAEARVVAEAVIEHATTSPDHSLGVGAFSVAQQELIEDEIERLRRESKNPAVEAFFAAHEHEPFFVKNLETIQGDERDVIFLSVGYGPDEQGKVTNNFGPINADGGWRRLNVLVTRAKQRCRLYSSMTADKIRVGADSPRGVVALKNFLHFAEKGTLPAPQEGDADADRPFVQHVAEQLRSCGWEVHTSVGCRGFAVDAAVVDPDAPERYLLGVECDGSTYRAAATARDRDRTRPAVLEGLGWSLRRVWSADWLKQPETTMQQLLDALESRENKAHAAYVSASRATVAAAPKARVVNAEEADEGPPAGFEAYRRFDAAPRGDREKLLKTAPHALARLIAKVVEVEGPVHREELLRIAAKLYEARVTGDAQERLEAAVDRAMSDGSVALRGAFVWPAEMREAPLRWRGGEDAVRATELICVEEVARATRALVEREYGIPVDDVPAATLRLMGFKRTTDSLLALGRAGYEAARGAGWLRTDRDGFVVAADGEASAAS